MNIRRISVRSSESAPQRAAPDLARSRDSLAARPPTQGERRRISVLFADIANSTKLAMSQEPEDANLIVADVLRTISDAVERHGGTVEQTRGDGIVAMFGARSAHEDHAVRACLAALGMQQEVAAMAESLSARAGMPIRIRVGVNSGDGLVRPASAETPTSYTADGPTTNIAAKLEEHARAGATLVTSEVVRLVEGYVETRPCGTLRVDGAPVDLDTYELVGVTNARSRFEAAARRGLSEFVGRELETAFLERSADLAERGRGQALRIIGAAGVGKTRLAWEFRRRLHDRGWNVIASSSLARGTRRPYSVLVDVVESIFRLAPGTTVEVAAPRVLRCGDRLVDVDVDLPPLLALLDVDNAGWESTDAAARRARTCEAVIALLLREAERGPTLVSVEDVQWADQETREFFDVLGARIDSSRLVVLLEFRSEHERELERNPNFQTLQLESLPDPCASALLRELVGDSESLDSLEAMILAQVRGNPFFVEEIVRMLVAEGTLVGTAGKYEAAASIASIRIPSSVRDVLAARIARLSERDREVVQTASVIGKDVADAVLRQVCGLAEPDLALSLDRLVDATLLAKVRTEPTVSYGFVHAFTHDVAYDSIHRTLRKKLHSRVLDALGSLYPGSREHLEQLAHHASSSERWDEAVGHLQQAARRAFERSANHKSVQLLEEAIQEVVPNLSPAVASPALEVDLHLDLRSALLALGDLRRVEIVLREAERLARTSGDLTRQYKVAAYMCGHYWMTGEHQSAVENGERALRLAIPLGDDSLLIPTRTYVGAARLNMGENKAAQEILTENIRSLAGVESPEQRFGMSGVPKVFALALRALSRTDTGDFEGASADAREAMRIAEEARHGFSIQSASFGLGCLYLTLGQLPLALEVLERALAISRDEKHRFWLPAIGPLRALVLAELDRPAEAEDLLAKTARNLDNPRHGTFTVVTASEVYLRLGKLEAAHRLAEVALQRSRRKHERGFEARALWLQGEIAVAHEQPDLRIAEALYRAAIERAAALEMRPIHARSRLGLAYALARSGARKEARKEFNAAREMHSRMKSLFWLERGRARLGELH